MKHIFQFFLSCFFLASITANAQLKNRGFVSGDYEEIKVSCDTSSKSFTAISDVISGNFSCTLFLKGKMKKNNDGKYPIEAFLWGSPDKNIGTLFFNYDKKNHDASIRIQLDKAGACQNMIDFEHGTSFSFENAFPYYKFSMVKVEKAIAYSDTTEAHRKGYLVQYDLVSVILENGHYCFIEYLQHPSDKLKRPFRAWIKKSDLIL